MVKWGIRSSRGKEKDVSSYRYKDQAKGRGGKSSSSSRREHDKREYNYDDDDDDSSASQQSSDLDEDESYVPRGGRAGDYRGDNEVDEELYDGEGEDEEDDDFGADENDDPEGRVRPPNRQRELVTRDQVLGELRAQAAADALGKSLEQMGYNLDNCDSFYSLSDQENAVDQRYMIQSQPSVDLTRSSAKKRRSNNKKSKKKKNKKLSSAQSRYTVASDDEEDDDEEESTVMYGRSYRGDFEETYADSFTEMTDDFSYGDESSLSGMSSRFTRFKKPSGKKPMRKQRAATIKSKKHRATKRGGGGRDSETYYTRDGESSYGRTIDESSTISSVSSGSEDDDALTEYTEPTRRGGRRLKKTDQKNKRRGGRGSGRGAVMRAIEEEEKEFGRSFGNHNRREGPPPLSKRAAEIMKRNDSDRFSGSSQIGAMRSVDSFVDDDNAENVRVQDTGIKIPTKKEKSAPKKAAKKASATDMGEDKTPKKSSRKHRKLPSDESLYSDQESTDNNGNFDATKKHSASESDNKKTADEQRDEEDGSLSGNESFSDGESEEEIVGANKKLETAYVSKDTEKASFWPKQFMALRGKKKTTELLLESEKAKLTVESNEEKNSSETTSVQLIDDMSAKNNDEFRGGIASPPKHFRKEGSDVSLIPELLKSQDSETYETTKKDNNNSDPNTNVAPVTTQAGNSIGLLEAATMAALIPLAPFAAAYSCYASDATQSLIKSANCTDTACTDTACTDTACAEQETSKAEDNDNLTRSTTKSHSSKRKKMSKSSKHGVRSTKSSDPSLVSSKSRRSQKSSNSKPKEADVPVDTEVDFTSIIGTKAGGVSSEAPPAARIQEELEGFESFLPVSLDGQTQAESVASSLKRQPTGKKKNKRWLPKLSFRSHKKKSTDNKAVCVVDTEKARDAMPPLPVNNATLGMPPQHPNTRVPSTLPKPSMNRKDSAGIDSTKALQSFYTETPKSAPEMIVEDELKNALTPDGNLRVFDSDKLSSTNGGDKVAREDSDFAKLPLRETKSKKSQNKNKNRSKSRNKKQASGKEDAKFDPATATEEELLKYYDLGQTLSEVIDARETLENAYGRTSGGASFDHTIDEQLVELLTHMAEMDEDDAVEIEAAIKKLKKHARKLGISERDLLFSAKSAEEGTTADPPVPEKKTPPPVPAPAPTVGFGDKVLDAFEGYFGRR